jgi:hypothetical protein
MRRSGSFDVVTENNVALLRLLRHIDGFWPDLSESTVRSFPGPKRIFDVAASFHNSLSSPPFSACHRGRACAGFLVTE